MTAWTEAGPLWALVPALAIDTIALVSVWRSRRHSRKSKMLWTAVVLVLPAAGPLAWYALGRERRRAGRSSR